MFYKRMVELDGSLLRECTEDDPHVDFVSIEQYRSMKKSWEREKTARQQAQELCRQCWEDRKRGK